jgi:hypothetical protein
MDLDPEELHGYLAVDAAHRRYGYAVTAVRIRDVSEDEEAIHMTVDVQLRSLAQRVSLRVVSGLMPDE